MKRTAMMAAMLAAAMTVSFTGAVYAGETETSTEAATEADGAGEGTENIPGYGGFSAEDVKNASNVQPEIPEGATVLKLGTTVNENDSFQIAAVKFAQLVQDKTNGKYAIEIHPNGDLGADGYAGHGHCHFRPVRQFLPGYGCSGYAIPVRRQRAGICSL